jgi:uncharacterized protein YqhQ
MTDEVKYDLQAKPQNEMQFSYGGQAVIEGVMMRGAHKFAVAVRDPEGNIVIHEQPINKALYRGSISKTPFLRGLVGLWDALGLGVRALMWSGEIAAQEPPNPDKPEETQGGGVDFNGPIGWTVVAFSLIMGLGLFLVLPHALATFIASLIGVETLLVINLIEGVVQLAILIAYISLTGLMPDMKRVYGYHGAEHKTINAYEAGAELTPEVVAKYPIEHPRCGTAFLLTVAFVGILAFALVDTVFGRLVITRLLLIPLIAGIAYEVIRFTARNMDKAWVRVLIIPNLALQHLTTRQPDLSMIEVAIAAFKRVLVSESIIAEEPAHMTEEPPNPVQPTVNPVVGD